MYKSLCQNDSEVRDISLDNAHTLTLQYVSFSGIDLLFFVFLVQLKVLNLFFTALCDFSCLVFYRFIFQPGLKSGLCTEITGGVVFTQDARH